MIKFWRQTFWLKLFSAVAFAVLAGVFVMRRPPVWGLLAMCAVCSLSAGWGALDAWRRLRAAREDEAVRRLVAFYEREFYREHRAERPGEMVDGEWKLRARPREYGEERE